MRNPHPKPPTRPKVPPAPPVPGPHVERVRTATAFVPDMKPGDVVGFDLNHNLSERDRMKMAERTTDAHKVQPLADALTAWLDGIDGSHFTASCILRDAIKQATRAETIEWFASIAERYGFKHEPT